jgi:hypothetical protein
MTSAKASVKTVTKEDHPKSAKVSETPEKTPRDEMRKTAEKTAHRTPMKSTPSISSVFVETDEKTEHLVATSAAEPSPEAVAAPMIVATVHPTFSFADTLHDPEKAGNTAPEFTFTLQPHLSTGRVRILNAPFNSVIDVEGPALVFMSMKLTQVQLATLRWNVKICEIIEPGEWSIGLRSHIIDGEEPYDGSQPYSRRFSICATSTGHIHMNGSFRRNGWQRDVKEGEVLFFDFQRSSWISHSGCGLDATTGYPLLTSHEMRDPRIGVAPILFPFISVSKGRFVFLVQ